MAPFSRLGHHLLIRHPHDDGAERKRRIPPGLLDRTAHEPLVRGQRDRVRGRSAGLAPCGAPWLVGRQTLAPLPRQQRPATSSGHADADPHPPTGRRASETSRPGLSPAEQSAPAGRGAGCGGGGRLVPADHAPIRPADVGRHVQPRALGLGHRPAKATATSRTIPKTGRPWPPMPDEPAAALGRGHRLSGAARGMPGQPLPRRGQDGTAPGSRRGGPRSTGAVGLAR